MMQEQELEISDATIGVMCKVEKHNSTQNRTRFKNTIADIGDEVCVLSPSEHSQLMELINDAKNTPPNANADEVKPHLEQTNDNADMINELKQELDSKDKTIADLTTSNNEYKARIDALGMQLDNSVDASELEDLQQKLDKAQKDAEYWQESYGKLSDEHLGIVDENESLRKDNNSINATNKMLNDNIIGLTATFESTKEQLTSDFQKQEKELKETIKKQQAHIDELTDKYQSLLVLKEHIPQKQHYDEINALQSKLNDAEKELESIKASIESKLATQKSELDIEHAKEINNLKSDYADEKAQLFVASNTTINNLKHEKNDIAKQYNDLLEDVGTITKINAVFGSRHEDIIKNRTPIELEDIPTPPLPLSDEDVLEYVPKDKKQE